MEQKSSSPSSTICKVLVMTLGLFVVLLITVVVTVVISRNFFAEQLCSSALPVVPMFSKTTEWDGAERMEAPNKRYSVVTTEVEKRCYLMPTGVKEEKGKPRPFGLIREPLSEEIVEQLAGPEAVLFCQGYDTYLLRELKPEEVHGTRQKREERDDGGIVGKDNQGLDIPIEQRTPNCMDLILDCSLNGAVGQVQTCYTWINGVIRMAQTCEAPNKFSIHMTKPPGRILKIAQKQWVICVQRRQQGLRC